MAKLYTEDTTTIKASINEVWDALVNPGKTKEYMFGCEVESDWTVGNPVLWKGAQDGVVYVKGKLVEFEKGKVFSFTTFDPLASYEDVESNYLTATYTLEEQGENVLLTVTQGDYATVADGDVRYKDTLDQGGWSGVLAQIKTIMPSLYSMTKN